MKKIAMVVGEDFWLRIPMNNESAGRHLCMDDVEVIHAWLESGYGGCWTLPLETDGEQLEGVAVKVPGSRLGLGTYAVVMAGKFVNGGHFRTKRQLFIRLVDREEQADAKPTMFNEEKAYWAGPAVLSGMLSRDGLNTYELAVLHGYDGTLEQFLAQAGIELQDFMVTKAKLSREVQTQLDKGSEKAINPAGDYDAEAEYSVNEMVYDEETNSSYVSKQSVNVGHAVTDTDWWMKVLDGNYVQTTIQAIMTAAQETLDEAKQDTIDATVAALAAKQATEQATTAANAVVAQKVADAQIGYYVCETAAGTATKATTTNTIGQSTFAVPVKGCIVKVKMANANTATDTVYLQFGSDVNTKKELKYNGLAVDASNSWEEGEVISVYYDGTYYQASNAMGGGSAVGKKQLKGSSGYINLNIEVGQTVPTTVTTSQNVVYKEIKVKEGDVFLLTDKKSGTGGRAWGFIDSNRVLLDVAEANIALDNEVIVVPEGVDKVILHAAKDSTESEIIYEWYYAKAGSVGAHEILTEAYLYGDMRIFDVGHAYELNEAVKTADMQLLKVSKEIKPLNLTDEIIMGDLKCYSNNTYQALKAVVSYDEEGEYSSGDYAIADGVVKKYDGEAWTAVVLADWVADAVIWKSLTTEELIKIASEENHVPKIYNKWGLNADGSMSQNTLFYNLNYFKIIDMPDYIQDRKIDGNTGKWSASVRQRYYLIPVEYGQVYRILANASTYSTYAWFRSIPVNTVEGGTPPYAVGETNQHVIPSNESVDIQVPFGARYMYIFSQLYSGSSYTSYAPQRVYINKERHEDFDTVKLFEIGQAISTPRGYVQTTGGAPTNTWINSNVTYGNWTDVTEYAGKYMQFNDNVRIYFFASDYPVPGDISTILLGNGVVVSDTRPVQIPQPATEGGKVLMYLYTTNVDGTFCNRRDVEIVPDILSKTVRAVKDNASHQNVLGKEPLYSTERLLRIARFADDNANNIGILHFSDLHNDGVALAELRDFVNTYRNMFDDIVETGDGVYLDGEETKYNLSDNILFVPGNHEAANHNAESYSWAWLSKEYLFNKFVAPYIESRGVTMPTGYDVEGNDNQYAMYWYKDYNNGIYKVRIIGIDCMHYYHMEPTYTNDAQEKWLCDTLADAQENGFKVIIASHYPLDDFEGAYTKWDEETHRWKCNYVDDPVDNTGGYMVNKATNNPVGFHLSTANSYESSEKQHLRERPRFDKKGTKNNFGEIITAWIEGGSAFNGYKTFQGGGDFVAWICGHLHRNIMYYPTMFPKILTIVNTCVGTRMYGYNTNNPRINVRKDGVYNRLSANVYYIQGNYLKIIRAGNNLSQNLLVPSSWLIVNYKTGEVITEG